MQDERRVALVVVDHGSRSAASNAALDAVAAELAALSAGRYVAVLTAHMEIAPPSLGEAFDAAVDAGADFVVVALWFLSPGRHSEIDVPALAAEAAARHAGVGFAVTPCLGPHASLHALLLERAAEAVASSPGGGGSPSRGASIRR